MTKTEQRYNLEHRVAEFASRVIAVCDALPAKTGAAHIKDQMFRSCTSVAANYAEASVPESRKDFIHKMNIALKEIVETRMWLTIISMRKYLNGALIEPLVNETNELAKIFHSSVMTAKKKLSTGHED